MLQPKEYVESRNLSQSDLKLFRKSIRLFYDQVERGERVQVPGTKATNLGDIVDCMCTNPEGLNDYYIVKDVQCSENIKNIVTSAFTSVLEYTNTQNFNPEGTKAFMAEPENVRQFIVNAARAINYQKTWGDDALFTNIWKAGNIYFKSLADSHGRDIIDQAIYDQAEKCKNKLFNDPFTGKLMAAQTQGDSEVLNQAILFGSYNNTGIKGLLDKGLVLHDKKGVWPYDIKTAASIQQFWINYFKWGYGYQGSQYYELLQMAYPGYTIQPFRFIVCPTETEEAPLIFRMHMPELGLYANGGFDKFGRRIIGWKETILDIEWHRENNRWDYPKSYYETGEIIIDSLYFENESNSGDPF